MPFVIHFDDPKRDTMWLRSEALSRQLDRVAILLKTDNG
jgi:hypothetical protein